MIRNSIIVRLLALVAGGILLVLLVVGPLVDSAISDALESEFDTAVVARTEALAILLEIEEGEVHFEFTDQAPPAFWREHDAEYFQIWVGEDRVVERSHSLGEDSLPRRVGTPGAPVLFDTVMPDGRPVRCAGVRYPIVHEDDVAPPRATIGRRPIPADVVVGMEREALDERIASTLTASRAARLIVGVVFLACFVAGIVLIARSLGRVRRGIESLDPETVGPVSWDHEPPLELRPLTRALDKTLEQLGDAVDRERRLLAGIAHELRTPVAELLTVAEVALERREELERLQGGMEEARAVGLHMKSIVETLLRLTRARESGHLGEIRRVEMEAVWSRVRAGVDPEAQRRDISLEAEPFVGLPVHGNQTAVQVVLAIFTENAVLHAPTGSTVRVEAESSGAFVLVHLHNPAPDLTDADLDRMTEPFWRKEPARTHGRGVGLGLHLAVEAVRLMQGKISYELRDGWLHCTLTLPAARA